MIADVPVGEIVVPTTLDEAAATLREAARRRIAVSFMGGGTELGYGRPPASVGVLLKTERLNRVLEYTPSDMVVSVEAGMILGALQRTLAANAQRLALDPPQPEGATLGGLLATNTYGPLRTRYGTLRDLIIGIEVIRADGTRARGGGRVVKNVAGFDLPKLMVGSLGTLAFIASATFRLHPLPERRQWYAIPGRSLEDIRAFCRGLLERQLEPAAIFADLEDGSYTIYTLFEGFAAGVEGAGAKLNNLLKEIFGSDARRIEVDGANVVEERDRSARTHGEIRVRLSTPPALVGSLECDVVAPLRGVLSDARIVLYPTVGVVFIGGFGREADRLVTAIERARAMLEAAGGQLVMLECTDPAVRERIDPFGTPPESFGIMQRLKDRFDPERRLNPGRFVGGL